jgi:hypothetical protein
MRLMAHQLSLGPVDNSDEAFEPLFDQPPPQSLSAGKIQQEAPTARHRGPPRVIST